MGDPALSAETATVRHEALAYLASDHDSRLRAHRFAAAVVGLTEPVAGNTRASLTPQQEAIWLIDNDGGD